MNRDPFGEKCKCGHFESEHIAGEMRYDDVSITQLKSMYGLLPSLESKVERKDCKVCGCKKFDSKKKGWGF